MRRPVPSSTLVPALMLGGLTLALHLWANGSYDYFRDELYFIVCGEHLAWGYVDQPPLVPLIAHLARALFGDSVLGLRLMPALADAALVALGTIAAGRLGGGVYARWLAGLALLAAPLFRVDGLLLSTDFLQPLAWLAASLLILDATERERPAAWYALGAVTGVALLDKYMIAFFLVAAGIGLVLTREQRALLRPAPWLAGLLALVIVLPNLFWQQSHGWPFLELGKAAAGGKNIAYGPLGWLVQEALLMNPLTAPIWLAGLAGFAAWPRLARGRWIAIAWAVLMVMMLAMHGKPYYPAGIYPILFAGGAVVIEAMIRPALARGAIVAWAGLAGLLLLPFMLPVLPVEQFVSYQRAIGLEPQTGEKQALGALPQYYADMFGWREMAAAVGQAYQALPPEDQAHAVFFGNNYGEAAAIDVFGAPWHLPPAISGHNNYFLWGPGDHDGSIVLLVSKRPREALLERFESVEAVGEIGVPYAMPYERGLTLYLCRNSKLPLAEAWPRLKHYE